MLTDTDRHTIEHEREVDDILWELWAQRSQSGDGYNVHLDAEQAMRIMEALGFLAT